MSNSAPSATSHSDYLRLMGVQEWQSRLTVAEVSVQAEPNSDTQVAATTEPAELATEPTTAIASAETLTTPTKPQAALPVVTKALKAGDVISKSGKPCPVCIEKNVIQFQTMVAGQKWFWLVSAFGYQGQFTLDDEAGRLLQAMLSAVKSDAINAADVRVMGCEEVPDQNCAEWIALQIKQKAPDLVMVMGLSLSRLLLMSRDPKAEIPVDLSGGDFDLMGLPLIATHHPAEILADKSLKRQVWADLQKGLAKKSSKKA